jgi:hypothetical protein
MRLKYAERMQPEHGVLLVIGVETNGTIKLGDYISRAGFLQSVRLSTAGSYPTESRVAPICATREHGDRTFHAEHALIAYTNQNDLIIWSEETQEHGLVTELTRWCKAAI